MQAGTVGLGSKEMHRDSSQHGPAIAATSSGIKRRLEGGVDQLAQML